MVYFLFPHRFRGKKEVRKSAKYEMSYEEEFAALVIHKTEPDDADVYRCEVSNPLGRVQTEGTLAVHSELCFCLIETTTTTTKKKKKGEKALYTKGLYMPKESLVGKNES